MIYHISHDKSKCRGLFLSRDLNISSNYPINDTDIFLVHSLREEEEEKKRFCSFFLLHVFIVKPIVDIKVLHVSLLRYNTFEAFGTDGHSKGKTYIHV